jgi:hypothetical protein
MFGSGQWITRLAVEKPVCIGRKVDVLSGILRKLARLVWILRMKWTL